MMLIIVSGLTAAGKTTHAERMAEEFDLVSIGATEVFRSLAGGSLGDHPWGERWTPELDNLRRAGDLDRQVDEVLVDLVGSAASGVFDAALLPWLSKRHDALRLWIESDFESRVRKCVVSHLGDEDPLDLAAARAIVAAKDATSSRYLMSVCGARLRPDKALFNAVLDNSSLIPEASVEAARVGIEKFALVLRQALDYLCGTSKAKPKNQYVLWLSAPVASLVRHQNGPPAQEFSGP